jgi:hypothetical protein
MLPDQRRLYAEAVIQPLNPAARAADHNFGIVSIRRKR